MSPDISRLLYLSKSGIGIGEASYPARRAILASARAHNLKNGVTGALVFASDWIGQILEGPPDAVEDTFARICRDPRHRDITVLTRSPAMTRIFPDWSMAVGCEGEAKEKAASIVFQRCLSHRTEASAIGVIEFLLQEVSAAQIW